MSDMAYIMETQDPHELWLVDGENKFKVSRDMYWLLVSKGADLPPTHHITELLDENAKLRELVRDLYSCGDSCTHCRHWNQGDGFYCDLGVGWKAKRMRELGVVDE